MKGEYPVSAICLEDTLTCGFTQEQVQSILEDIDGSPLIDQKTKKLLALAKTVTKKFL